MEFFLLLLLFFLIEVSRPPDKYLDMGGNDITREMIEQQERDRERCRRAIEYLHIKRKG